MIESGIAYNKGAKMTEKDIRYVLKEARGLTRREDEMLKLMRFEEVALYRAPIVGDYLSRGGSEREE